MATPILTQKQAVKQLKAIEALIKSNPKADKDFACLSGLVECIFNSKTPSYALHLEQASIGAYLQFGRLLPEASLPQFESFLGGLRGVLLKKGYRWSSLIITTQEHELIGSTTDDTPDVYVPIGLLRGELTLDEVKKARNLRLYLTPLALYYLLDDHTSVTALLEKLGPDGRTMQDPRLIHPYYTLHAGEIFSSRKYEKLVEFGSQLKLDGLPHQKSDDYPYPRP